jgi:hypothetical protein
MFRTSKKLPSRDTVPLIRLLIGGSITWKRLDTEVTRDKGKETIFRQIFTNLARLTESRDPELNRAHTSNSIFVSGNYGKKIK